MKIERVVFLFVATLMLAAASAHASVTVSNLYLIDDWTFSTNSIPLPDADIEGGEEIWRYKTRNPQPNDDNDIQIYSKVGVSANGLSDTFQLPGNLSSQPIVTGLPYYASAITTLESITPDFRGVNFNITGGEDLLTNVVPTANQDYQGWYTITLTTLGGTYTATSDAVNLITPTATNAAHQRTIVADAWNNISWDSDPFFGGGIGYDDITSIAVDFSFTIAQSNAISSAWWNMREAPILYEVALATNDTVAPAVPSGLVASSYPSQVLLDWDDNTEGDMVNGFGSYIVYRGTSSGIYDTNFAVSSSFYTDTDVVLDTTYYYAVSAIDYVGNESASNTVSATPTNNVPAIPTGLAAPITFSSKVVLDWDDNVEPEGDLDFYEVHRGSSSGVYDSIFTATASAYTDFDAINGRTYYYAVLAVDESGAKSALGAEVSDTPDAVANPPIYSENYDTSPAVTVLTTSSTPQNNSEMLDGVLENTWAAASTVGFVSGTNMYITSSKDKMRAATYTITADQFPSADPSALLSFDVLDIWNNGFLEVVVVGINNPGVAGDAVIYDVLSGSGETYGTGIGLFTNGATASVTTLGSLVIGGLADNDVASVVTNHTITFNYNGTDDIVLFFGAAANAGLSANKRASWDNVQVTLSPPAPLYDTWADSWGVVLGANTDDYDSDGLLNLYEFGLGGNPTNGVADGELPVFAKTAGGGLEYVYAKRVDDSSLTYSLELTDNLVVGSWTNVGYTVTGTGTSEPLTVFDYVTNSIETVDDAKFIRLKIEQTP